MWSLKAHGCLHLLIFITLLLSPVNMLACVLVCNPQPHLCTSKLQSIGQWACTQPFWDMQAMPPSMAPPDMPQESLNLKVYVIPYHSELDALDLQCKKIVHNKILYAISLLHMKVYSCNFILNSPSMHSYITFLQLPGHLV